MKHGSGSDHIWINQTTTTHELNIDPIFITGRRSSVGKALGTRRTSRQRLVNDSNLGIGDAAKFLLENRNFAIRNNLGRIRQNLRNHARNKKLAYLGVLQKFCLSFIGHLEMEYFALRFLLVSDVVLLAIANLF